MLFTFNTFKDLLDAYRSRKLPSVSVYIRINDWVQDNSTKDGYNNKDIFGDRKDHEMVFLRDSNDAQKMIVSLENCGNLDKRAGLIEKQAGKDFSAKESLYHSIKNVKVEEVYDTQNFKDNGVISKYMSLPVQLSQKKGIMMVTYGYSGTGKTFSLFGNGTLNGLLQTTLLEIRGQEKIFFRLYEIYAMGVQYNFYWKNPANVFQRVYTYQLITKNNKLDVKSVGEEKTLTEINSFIEKVKEFYPSGGAAFDSDGVDTYAEIDYSIFKNFSDFTQIIDQIREKKYPKVNQEGYPQRIKPTTNNPVSSRSILVYDFQILLKDGSVVPFVIVDLPGKENIVQSYIQNSAFAVTGDNSDTKEPAIAAALLLNPIFSPLFKKEYTQKIKDFINSDFDDRANIMDKWKKKKVITILSRSSGGGSVNSEPVSEYIGPRNNLTSTATSVWKGKKGYDGPNGGDIQRYNNAYVYFISTLIKEGRIDLLVKLITKLVEGEDGEINNIEDYDNLEEKIRLAYEGIAINENILGLVYTMISRIEVKEGEYKNPAFEIKSQEDKSDLSNSGHDRIPIAEGYTIPDGISEQHSGKNYLVEDEADIMARVARAVNRKIYKNTNNPSVNVANNEYTLYQKSVETYDPERIYSAISSGVPEATFKPKINPPSRPLIHQLLLPYIGETKNDAIIDNIYIFYLLTNNDPDKKCKNQIDLLVGAEKFLKALDPLDE